MKLYELKLIPGGKGVFKISIVDEPAVEADIVKFEKENEAPEVVCFNDEERRVFYSVAMRPNKKIPRKNINGEAALTFYTKETVQEAALNYWRQKGNLQTNINHNSEADASGVFPFESWIVEDPETDKSKALGLETFAGDWVVGYKVDSAEIWNDYIKTGKLKGLSIEATHHKYELIPEIKMEKTPEKKETKVNKLLAFCKELFMEEEETPETPAELTEEDSEKKVEEAEAKAEEMEEHEDPKPTEEEEETPAEEEEEPKPDEEKEALLQKIAALEAEIATLKAKQIETDTALETMKKETPAAPAIKDLPPVRKPKSYEEMTNFEKVQFNRENSKF